MRYCYGMPFHIVPFQCCKCFWVFKVCCFELWSIFEVWYFNTYKCVKYNFLVAMEVLNAFVCWNALENQNRFVWTTPQAMKNGWDSCFFVRCSLFHFCVECAHGHMVARKHGKMITHFFCSKIYLWMRKYNIVVIVFSFDFEGEMNYSLPLCVHERVL